MGNNVQFAVIAPIHEMPSTAFFSSERMIAFKREKSTGADAPNTN
jgi:hypothetical protein